VRNLPAGSREPRRDERGAPASRRFRLANGALALVAVGAVCASALLALGGSGSQPPARPGRGLLIERARVSQPHLLAVPGGFVGWWLQGTGANQSLVVARLSTSRGVTFRRTLPLGELAPGQSVTEAPLFATGPGGRLFFTYRALDRRMRADTLYAASWNSSLRGAPEFERIRVDPLVHNQRAIDYGPHGQSLSYQAQARSFLLAEEDVRPWFSQNMQLPNRPQLLVTLIAPNGRRHLTRVISMPAAQSFIDPLVRATEDGTGFDLFVVRPGDSTVFGPEPDQLLSYRLDARLRQAQPARLLTAPDSGWSIIDEAVGRLRSGADLLVWELAGPETGLGEAKLIVGSVFRDGRLTRPPAVLSSAVSPRTVVPAQLSLAPQPDGELLSFNTGTAAVFETVHADATTPVRVLFKVTHPLYLQPQTAVAYNQGAHTLAGLWQDPGRALSPNAVAAAAPLYLNGQPTP
jgi:hypothetical protein